MSSPNGEHPWLVVDTWGEKPPVGCWTEAAARGLPARISAPYEAGRWKAQQAEHGARSGASDG